MAAYLSPIGNEQQSDSNGAPVSGALINTYLAGTTTPVVTYTDAAGLVPQANPIVCNAAGYPASPIFISAGVAVKMVFTTSVASGSVAYRPAVDNITGVNDPSFATTVSEYTAYSGTPSFISATSFSVTGDQTNVLTVGRQLKTTNTGGTIYSTITASVFGAVTTVTVSNVAGVLDSGLTAVSYGLLNPVNPSLPKSVAARSALGAGATGDSVFTATTPVLARVPLEVEPGIKPITASVATNALTITLNPCLLNFRSATLTSGTTNARTVAAAISVVVPSTATLGTVSTIQSRLAVLAIDNAGTVELAVVNLAGGTNLDETGVISTTAISAAATSASVVYSTTARSNVPYRVVGYVESTQATAGTWATAPSTIQGAGGQAVSSMASIGYGQVWQVVTRNSGTTYYNTTGKPIMLNLLVGGASGGTVTSVSIAGVDAIGGNAITVGAGVRVASTFIIPPNAAYSYTLTAGNATATELR